MASPNEIGMMMKIAVKPKAWRLVEHADGIYCLDFTYVEPSRGDWCEVLTRRSGRKWYKTASAALRDIARVHPDGAVVEVWQRPVYGKGGDHEA